MILKEFEAYILLTIYPKMLLKENVKFIITDFINFTALIHFLELLNLMQHNKFSLCNIKFLFINVLYHEVFKELSEKKYTCNLILSKVKYPLTIKLTEKNVELIVHALINMRENGNIQLSENLGLNSSIKLEIESYLKNLKLHYLDDIVGKIVNHSSYENVGKIPTLNDMINLNLHLYKISETNKTVSNLKKLSTTLILSEVMILPKLIRNTQLLLLLKNLECDFLQYGSTR